MKTSLKGEIIATLLLCSVGALAQTPSGQPGMKSGMSAMPGTAMTGDNDKDFAMMMKMHHQQALDMARKELADGKSPQLKSMARKIVESQTKEIAEFDRWLSTHK